jgi:hypothetical protein
MLIKVENVHVACRVINSSAKTISTSAKTKPIQTKSNPKTAFFWKYENMLESYSKGFSWKDPPSTKPAILHVTFTTIHNNN